MSLDLHPQCIRRLVSLTAKALEKAVVVHNCLIDSPIWEELKELDAVVPSRVLQERISLERDDDFVLWTIYDFISDITLSREYVRDAQPVVLRELSEYQDLTSIAETIIARFNSLPWRYAITLPMPTALAETILLGEPIRTISPSLRVISGRSDELLTFQIHRGRSGLELIGGTQRWKQNGAYLQISVDGFLSSPGGGETLESVTDRVKQFIGIGLALQLFKSSYGPQSSTEGKSAFVHCFENGVWEQRKSVEIGPTGLLLNRLIPGEGARSDLVKQMEAAFSNKHALRVQLASQWLVDGMTSSNELLSFIQTMTSLEILFGDKKSSDAAGLQVLLKNRCAYLVGKTVEARQLILDEFDHIYDVRSRIVHRGHKRLTRKEQLLYLMLRKLLLESIAAEVNLLVTNSPSATHQQTTPR